MKQYNKRTWLVCGLLLLLAACGGGSSGGAPGSNQPVIDPGTGTANSFPEPSDSQIRPGVGVTADGSFCTSNFIYQDGFGNFYIGAAAHCFSADTNNGVDPCLARTSAIGTSVSIENAQFAGRLAYSSWRAMQDNNETPGSAACDKNDFALIRIDSRDNQRVHPAAIVFEGPLGLLRGNANNGDETFSYGQSPSHFGNRRQEEKNGPVVSQSADGWSYTVRFDNPALSGDSGSAVLHESGAALGVLTVVSVGFPAGPTNGVLNLEMGLDYANDYLSHDVSLVPWSRFRP